MKKLFNKDLNRRRGSVGALFLLVFLPVLFFSCNQDPIFLGIAKEEAPKKPRISGSPLKLLYSQDGRLYVSTYGNSVLHSYRQAAGGWEWDSTGLDFSLLDLAQTDTYLYALTTDGSIRRMQNNQWDSNAINVPEGFKISAIYGTGDTLFVGANKEEPCTIFYIKGNDPPKELPRNTDTSFASFQGAVQGGNSFYLATNTGIYRWDGSSPSLGEPVSGASGFNVMGILQTGSHIVGAGREGNLIYGPFADGSFKATAERLNSGEKFTGAMTLWEKPAGGTGRLLLLGVQGSGTSSTHGYRELALKADGGLPLENDSLTGGLESPGDNEALSSVKDKYKYRSSIGTHPVQSIFQIPSSELVFATTSRNGLWSYRNESWNAEP